MLITISEEEYKQLMEIKRQQEKMVFITKDRYRELIEIKNRYKLLLAAINKNNQALPIEFTNRFYKKEWELHENY